MKNIALALVLAVLCWELSTAWVVRRVRIRIGKKRSAAIAQTDTEDNTNATTPTPTPLVLNEDDALSKDSQKALAMVCPHVELGGDVTRGNVQEAFDKADADKNGVLDPQELKVFATLAAVAEACTAYQQKTPQ